MKGQLPPSIEDSDVVPAADTERYIKDRIETRVAELLPTLVAKEEDRRFRQLKWVVAFIGIIGLGTITTATGYLVENAVERNLEMRVGNIADSLEFVRFSASVANASVTGSFTDADLRSFMLYLRKAAVRDAVRQSPEFIPVLQRLLGVLVSSSKDAALDEIMSLYKREALADPALVEMLLHHYGQVLASRTTDPRTTDGALKDFELLEAASTHANTEPLAWAYRALYLHRRDPLEAAETIPTILAAVDALDLASAERFYVEILTRSRASNWSKFSRPREIAIQQQVRSFISAYAGMMVPDDAVDSAYLRTVVAKDGLSLTEAELRANQIARGRSVKQ